MTTSTSTIQIPGTLDDVSRSFMQVLAATDPEAATILADEAERQASTLELIASENHATPTVMHTMGTWMTDKYAEGYPGKRYYSGCINHDHIEQLAIDRAKSLFGCEYANVQPHSGANANLAVYFALLKPGDTLMSVVLSDGGHLTHGSPVALPGKWLNPVHYPLVYDESREDCGYIDYDAVASMAVEHKPKILLCGYSAYPRTIEFAKFREIADGIGATMIADVAHIAGLIAGGAHPSPFPHAHIVTTTTHKTLRGPRGGLIMTNDEELSKLINKGVFPGTQGGPLMHMIAAKAVAFAEAARPEFKAYAKQVVANAAVLANELMDRGYHLVSGGTDNHLMLIDLRKFDAELTGKQAAIWLESSGIICNKNTVAQEQRSPFQTSGIRLGTPALTTRGMKEAEMKQVAEFIDRVLKAKGDEAVINAVRAEVRAFCKGYPLPQ